MVMVAITNVNCGNVKSIILLRKIQMKSTETVGELDHPDSQVINLT
jgi:hypothetical protein